MESWKVVKIVLESCSRTEAALSAMKKKVKKCDICGCSIPNDKQESEEDKLSPLQFDLLLTIMGSLKEIRRMEDVVPNNSSACPKCISRFQTLELLYTEISTLQNRVDDILAQISKIIQHRLKLVDSKKTKEVEDPSSNSDLSSISVPPPPPTQSPSYGCKRDDDKLEDTTTKTFTTTDCINTAVTLEEEDDDGMMSIKEEMDVDDDLEAPQEDDPPHLDGDPLHSDPSSIDNSRQCKIRAQNVISSIPKEDLPTTKPTKDNHCDEGENHSPNNDPDTTDMDFLTPEFIRSLFDERNYDKRTRVRNRAPPSEQKHTCEICGKPVTGLYTFSQHMETHKSRSERETLLCHKCPKTFLGERYLNEHMKYAHDNICPIKCQQCGKGFIHKGNLKSHMKSKHNSNPPEAKKGPFICSFCGRGYLTKIKLKVHQVKVHMRDQRIKCTQPTCKSTFSTESRLQRHLQHYHHVDDENKTRNNLQ